MQQSSLIHENWAEEHQSRTFMPQRKEKKHFLGDQVWFGGTEVFSVNRTLDLGQYRNLCHCIESLSSIQESLSQWSDQSAARA